MTKGLIEDIRQSLIPFVKKELLKINKDGLGESDAEEFEKDLNEVLDLAIKALEKQKPLEKFENVKDHICKLADDYKCWDNRLSHEESLELCNILKQQSNDCVSRQAVLEMIEQIQNAGGFIGYNTYSEAFDRVDNMPPVTPTRNKPKEDITEDEVRINMLELALNQAKEHAESIKSEVVKMSDTKLTVDIIAELQNEIATQREVICNLNTMNDELQAKLDKIKQIVKDHDNDSMPEDFWYIDKIKGVLEKE